LHAAALGGHVAAARALIRFNANLNIQDLVRHFATTRTRSLFSGLYCVYGCLL
jgi:hypothetical protein